MNRLIFAWIIVGGIALSGCPQSPTNHQADTAATKAAKTELDIVYTKDERTGICFAYIYDGSMLKMITVVPCDKVEQYLVK